MVSAACGVRGLSSASAQRPVGRLVLEAPGILARRPARRNPMTSTFPVLDRAASTTGPSTVLDLPVAMAALRGLTARTVPDRGGPVIDADHPLGAALIPYA